MRISDPGGLVALETHKLFVAGVKEAVRKARGRVPDPSTLSPSILGAQPLEFAMPPMMERAFGYRGDLRYVEFSYSVRTHEFGYSDGGDHVPSDTGLWTWFLQHPLVSPEVPEAQYPTLYGKFTSESCPTPEEFIALSEEEREKHWQVCHCLLLDRRTRQPYLCTRDRLILFFPLTEPDEEEAEQHTVFVDGLLLSPGSENYRAPVSPELVKQLRIWLDDQFEFMENRANWPVGGAKHSFS
jgi:hypothetical protein